MKRAAGSTTTTSSTAGSPALGPLHAAILWTIGAVLACLGVSFRLYDPDLWQHLAVGRAIWSTHALPMTNAWTWPTYGEPYVLPSWLFRVALWPVWALGHETGLTVWRAITLLATFAIAAATARRMGARGASLVVGLLWCALLFRLRSMVRPETLAGVLLAVQMWILEERRRGGRDHSPWLVPLAWLWINAHLSWYLAPLLTGFHVLAEGISTLRGRPVARAKLKLAAVLLASIAVLFLNPFGARAVVQPFQYALDQRNHPLFRMILELGPITWSAHARDGLAAWMALIAGSWAVRTVRGRGDLVDTLVTATFLGTALNSQRFVGFLAIGLAPIAARDLTEAVAALRLPAAMRAPWLRTAFASTVMIAGAWPQLSQDPWRPGLGFDWSAYPVRSCDWIEKHHVDGRQFSQFHLAGYQLWRFWPQRDRLPFMDIHQTSTREDEDLYAGAWAPGPAWGKLDAKYRFDSALLSLPQAPGQNLVDRLDADSTWALVFLDDAAALFVRRTGRDSSLARAWGYRITPAGDEALVARTQAAETDTVARAALRAELDRQIRESEYTWRAHSTLATLDLLDRRWDEAEAELERTRALHPAAPLLEARFAAARAGRLSTPR